MIYHDHTSPEYQQAHGFDQYNGAYYYSVEIVRNIIPRVKTDRPWVTINTHGQCTDHAVVFIHNNQHQEIYRWLRSYKDLVLVCGLEKTAMKMRAYGRSIYLPLSIDVAEVEKYKRPAQERSGVCYVGRPMKREGLTFPSGTDFLEGKPREELLRKLSGYEAAYAVGRSALEAKCLGLDLLPYDRRFPDTSIWQVLGNQEAAAMLQDKLDEVDKT